MPYPLVELGLHKIDKLCDAKFISKIVKTTKTDFALLVKKNADLRNFLLDLEKQMDSDLNQYKEMIEEYVGSISVDILKFRNELKEIKRQEKLRKKELEREALKAEIKREMEAEERKKEIEKKLRFKKALTPNPGKA